MGSPFDQAALVYSSLNFKGKPHHLSQLGNRERHHSVFCIRTGWGCHLHVTSVYYPNVLALCIQMEPFILQHTGLHPSNAHLTGIPMFPATVSDFVFSTTIWKVLRVLANTLLQSTVRVAQLRKVLVCWGCLTPVWLVSAKAGGLGLIIYNITC